MQWVFGASGKQAKPRKRTWGVSVANGIRKPTGSEKPDGDALVNPLVAMPIISEVII